jgi:hypothetical protein
MCWAHKFHPRYVISTDGFAEFVWFVHQANITADWLVFQYLLSCNQIMNHSSFVSCR